MSKDIHDPWAYFFDARRFAMWHRRVLPDRAKAIDIDLNGYCVICLRPMYLIEATSGTTTKPSSVIQAMADAAGCRAFVAHLEKLSEPPDWQSWSTCADAVQAVPVETIRLVEVWPGEKDHGWMEPERVAMILHEVRHEHESQCRRPRPTRPYDRHVLGGEQ